jgi:hypothetical protein
VTVTEDLHTPTSAAPSPGPNPAVTPSAGSPADRPEVLAGAAFAGGIVAAMILKRLGR